MSIQKHHVWEYPTLSTPKAILRFVFTWLVTLAIFVVLFSRIPFHDVVSLLQQTDMRFLCAGLLCSVLAPLFFSSARFQRVVKMTGCRISFGEAVIIRMGCNPIKGILPFKMGEFAILGYMKERHHLSYARGLLALLSGYMFSFTALIFFCSMGGLFYVQHLLQKMLFAAACLLTVLLIATSIRQKIFRPVALYIHKILRLPENVRKIIESYDPQIGQEIMIHSLAIEGCKLLVILFSFRSLSIDLPVDALLLWGSITIIAAYLPMTYWGLGIRESAVIVLFAGYAAPDHLLAAGLLTTFVDGLLPVLLGLFFVKPFLNNWLRSMMRK